ncbi:MAG: sulfotransferase [Actinomycetia bacterium]|nr:sulfotransferase [Actinomycetes bacterium]
MLPTFVVIGAMKAGTTTIHAWLADHPDVFMSEEKELDFFIESQRWSMGVAWYRSQFADAGDSIARGESSPDYTKTHNDPLVPVRMASVIPDARLVYLVREPISRMRSMYRHLVLDGTEQRSFEDAIAADDDYVETSRYMRQIRAFLEHYEADQILVVTTERLADDPDGTMAEVFDHIGVDPTHTPDVSERHNVTTMDQEESLMAQRLKEIPPYWAALNHSWRLRKMHDRLFVHPIPLPPADLPGPIEETLWIDLEEDTLALQDFIGHQLTEWGR